MFATRISQDPWLQTVHLLKALTTSCNGMRPDALPAQPSTRRGSLHVDHAISARTHATTLVSVVERPTIVTAIIDWRDATTGCYAEQTWRAGIARRCGQCALSGAPISTGDAIYRPRTTKHFLANADCMMLASAVNEAKDRES
jgi:Domain of unknown function (DUF3331)